MSTLSDSVAFKQMLEAFREIGGGPEGPPIDGRLMAAEMGRGLGAVPVGGGLKYEAAYADMITLNSLSPATSNATFRAYFRKHLDAARGDWDNYFKYLYWVMTTSRNGTVIAAGEQFTTYDEMIDLVKAEVPASGNFDESVYIFGYELVDTTDTYPNVRRTRNSLYSGIRGRARHQVRSRLDTYGVDANFNNGSFYQNAGTIDDGGTAVNWHNNLARNLVWHRLSADPGSNEDGAIWVPWGKRTRWNMPKVGLGMEIQANNSRGAVWDSTGSTWLTSGSIPTGYYQFEDPILLYDYRGRSVLDTIDAGSNNQGNFLTMSMVAILAFPVVMSARYYAFMIYPFGSDTWYTEYLDPVTYDLVVRTNFRHERQALYHIVTPSQHNGTAETMFNIWNKDKSGNSQLWKTTSGMPAVDDKLWWARSNLDNDRMPVGFDVCRRNKGTGVRSSYQPLFKIRRRIPYAGARIDPAFL